MAVSTNNIDSHVVIGSGPAGVACASALVERGAKVQLLDAGVALEPERNELISRMRGQTPSEWKAEDRAALREGMTANTGGIPLKRVYGSDFPYRECEEHLPAGYSRVGLRPSLARAGLSNVWGAAMMPYIDRDMRGWPITASDLSAHYAAVLRLTGLSARKDDLARDFPLYTESARPLSLSRQATALLGRLESHREGFANAGLSFGQARIAVQAREPAGQSGCVYCGQCMYGCPYGYIYSSDDTLRKLEDSESFNYLKDQVVTRVLEQGNSVRIEGYHRVTREPFERQASRVYLAAGVIPTTQILLRSQSLYEQPVLMKDSQYFLLPLALIKAAGKASEESLHTLSQIFLELFDREISPYTIHLQVYSYNDLIGQAVRGGMGPLSRPLAPVARALENRLMVMQGYLHSDHSAQMEATLRKDSGKHQDKLHLRAVMNADTKKIIGKVIKKLFHHSASLGGLPLKPMLQVAEPGRGFHSGGSFPMSAKPGPLETDTLGRPFGWRRVHAIDSTVLPGIPATTITFSVMANAHRIGCETSAAAYK